MSEEKAQERIPLFAKDPFGQLVALLVGILTIFVALVYFIGDDASSKGNQAWRDAQQFYMQAMGLQSRGQDQAGYAWSDAYLRWLELDTLASRARESGDEAAAERYAAAQERLSGVTPLLAPPYFDPDSNETPDINAYEADLYLAQVAALSEHYANRMRASDGWDAKSASYSTFFMISAFIFFMLALATTVVARMRWLFLAAGALLAFVGTFFVIQGLVTPVDILPETAIEAYAEGVGLAYQDDHVAALQAFDRATDLAPAYANAFYERAKTQAALGNLERAAADYKLAMETGRDDLNTRWNLGWTYYRLGRLGDSIEMTQSALELNPEQIALRFNLGLALLAQGQVDLARETYSAGFDLATRQVVKAREAGGEPPSTLWWYMTGSSLDLDNLLDCLDGQACDGGAPLEAIAASDALRAATAGLGAELKSLTTALEFTGRPPAAGTTADISDLAFVQPVYDEAGQVADYAPLDVQSVRLRGVGVYEEEGQAADLSLSRHGGSIGDLFVSFDYTGMSDGQLVVVKVYVDDRESVGLRLVEQWTLGDQGQALLALTPGGSYSLEPGEYRVEIYVDSELVQEGSFTIPE